MKRPTLAVAALATIGLFWLGIAAAALPRPEGIDWAKAKPVGLKPLTDMTGQDRYRGQDGGLYGNGKNEPPEGHLQAALRQAKRVRPLDGEGRAAGDGKIAFVSIGMSNTTQEFSAFVRLANADPAKSPKVVVVDGAQGGMDALAWAEPGKLNRPGARNPWNVLGERLQQAGVTAQQVQVAWVKQARIMPGTIGEFPKHAEEMKGHVVAILQKLKDRFPNLRIAYLSSRIYAGYAKTPLNPEPYAYESAFVVRWLIQDQIRGDAALSFDPEKGAARSPLVLWGPYLWADGEKGRKSDGLVWKPEDLAGDGTHPSDSGRRKVAELLLRFVKTDPTARAWYAKPGEDWTQVKYDCRRSGDAPDRSVVTPLGLLGAAKLTDAVFTAPVVAGGRVYVVDGSGTAFCFDAATLRPLWTFATRGGPANCNNVSSPAITGGYLHFGTMAGSYYVLDAASGKLVREIRCGEPIFSAPVLRGGRAYFVTLGSQVYALEADGAVCWTWDFVKKRLGFEGDRWSAADWLAHKKGRVTWRDQFCCARDMAAFGSQLVVPAGGEIIWLEDAGDHGEVRTVGLIPPCAGSERAANFGLSIGEDGAVYQQWHRRDNTGRVETLRLRDGKMATDHVAGTMTAGDMPGSLSFSSVSLRGQDVYRCRPEAGFGLCRHSLGQKEPRPLGAAASIASPILLADRAVYGGLDGRLYVAPLSGNGEVWSFATAFGKAISAPACVSGGRVYFGCEDGYLYALGPDGKAPLPKEDLELWKIRSPLTGKLADRRYDWYTNFGDFASTNANDQGIEPPLKLKWIRRYEGSFKHLPVCGGGRTYTHTAEGQVMAVEQETGRLLWRRFWPGVHSCYTSPLYHDERLLVPQAGLGQSRLRCLNAATGDLLWEAPFTGSPSWSRAQPPVVHKNLAIYMFGTGKYVPKGTGIYVMRAGTAKQLPEQTDGSVSWLYSHDNPFYPKDHQALVQAWDLRTGRTAWTRDFSEYGSGGDDAGLCLMNDTLYYSCFFGYAARDRKGQPGPQGVTAALEPATGKVKWLTTKYSVTAGCTISAADGRLYLGGYNQPHAQTEHRYVWCLDARDGSLVWQSEPVTKAINVVTVGPKALFAFAYGGDAYWIDRQTGKILSRFNHRYACTRFSLSGPYLLGSNMDMIDAAGGGRLVSTGPPLDLRECVGAVASNGRIFFTTQANGLQACQVYGAEAAALAPPWQSRPAP